jgi:hypothetical protein
VPRGKYSNLSVRREVREVLDELRRELGISDLNDLLVLLVRTYREHTNIISKIEEVVTNAVSKVMRETMSTHTNTISTYGSTTETHTSTVSTHTNSVSTRTSSVSKSGKRTAWDILVEQKVTCASEIRRGNPERVIESLKKQGAVVVKTDKDVCAVLPEFWHEFKRALNSIKTPNDQDVLSRLRDEKMKSYSLCSETQVHYT